MNLEYLLASLPLLTPGRPPGITPADFRAACEEQLSPSLAAAAAALLEDRPCDHPFAREWRARETILRHAVARRRAARRGDEAPREQLAARGSDLRIENGVAAAFEQPDPLQRERALDRLRWNVLDELQGCQPLTREAVLAYAVRLRMLEHWRLLDARAGKERLERLAALPPLPV
jgi:hypothetical protein